MGFYQAGNVIRPIRYIVVKHEPGANLLAHLGKCLERFQNAL